MWNIPHVPVSPCPVSEGWSGEYAKVMLKIDPIEAWTRTDFVGEGWGWLRDACTSGDYDAFLNGLSSVSPRGWRSLLCFYVHCSVDLDFKIPDDQVPSGLVGIVEPLCNFIRTVLMNEDLGRRVFEWLTNNRAHNVLFCNELVYNPHLPLDIMVSIVKSIRMTFGDALFADHWRRLPARFQIELPNLPSWKVPIIRGILVRGPEMAMAMRDEDHDALIDAIARCETWEEYEMMMMVASSSAIRLRTTSGVYGHNVTSRSLLMNRGIVTSVFFHDAYHLSKSNRDPSDIAHISPSNGTWIRDPESGCMMDLAGVLAEDGLETEMVSIKQFMDVTANPAAWESLRRVLRDDVLIRNINPEDRIAEMVELIIGDRQSALGIGILFIIAGMFRSSRILALAISKMKIDGTWDEWSSVISEMMPDVFSEMSDHHYSLRMVEDVIERFGPLDSPIDVHEFIRFMFSKDIPQRMMFYHGTSDRRYHVGFPGRECPPISEIGIVSARRMGGEDYEERDEELDVVFAASDPRVAVDYSYRSVGQDGALGVTSNPVILRIDLDVDDDVLAKIVSNVYRSPIGEAPTVADAICGFPVHQGGGGTGHIIVTKPEIGPSSIIGIMDLPGDRDDSKMTFDVVTDPSHASLRISPWSQE